jgi:hypothetical protein
MVQDRPFDFEACPNSIQEPEILQRPEQDRFWLTDRCVVFCRLAFRLQPAPRVLFYYVDALQVMRQIRGSHNSSRKVDRTRMLQCLIPREHNPEWTEAALPDTLAHKAPT